MGRYLNGTAAAFVEKTRAAGRLSFALDELLSETGLSLIAARSQLLRLGALVVRVTPRQPYFLIVSPEHRAVGAPPVDEWIDDYLQWLGCPYYLALQSAAAAYGASPQAIQETQLITGEPRRDITVGRLRLRFFMKSAVKASLTQPLPGARAPLMVSSPETTAYDLVRYAHDLGGIERIAETLRPLLPHLKAKTLRLVLQAENEVATAQRLGFLLDRLGAITLAKAVDTWLPRPRQKALLSLHVDGDRKVPADPVWSIIDNARCFP